MPPQVILAIGIIRGLILIASHGPELQRLFEEAKKLIAMWFHGGIITAAEQAQLMNWADAHQEATLRGEVPPELTVEPNL